MKRLEKMHAASCRRKDKRSNFNFTQNIHQNKNSSPELKILSEPSFTYRKRAMQIPKSGAFKYCLSECKKQLFVREQPSQNHLMTDISL